MTLSLSLSRPKLQTVENSSAMLQSLCTTVVPPWYQRRWIVLFISYFWKNKVTRKQIEKRYKIRRFYDDEEERESKIKESPSCDYQVEDKAKKRKKGKREPGTEASTACNYYESLVAHRTSTGLLLSIRPSIRARTGGGTHKTFLHWARGHSGTWVFWFAAGVPKEEGTFVFT